MTINISNDAFGSKSRSGAKPKKTDQAPLGKALFFGSISVFSPFSRRIHYLYNSLIILCVTTELM